MSQKTIYIKDLINGLRIRDVFLIADAQVRESKNGPFWNLRLQDYSGSVEAKIWSPLSQAFTSLETGMFVIAGGMIGSFRDQPQLTIEQLEILDPDQCELEISDFLPSSHQKPEEMMQELEYMVAEHMVHPPWKKFCRKVLNDDEIHKRLLCATGAKTVHHAYVGGLLEHTLSVAKLCMSICDNYPHIDRQVVLAAAIFHDLGKAWELTGGLKNDYTDEGRLLGHIHIGVEVLEPFLQKSKDLDEKLKLHFKHLILSHHGEYEFGAPKRPKTPEAFILHFADNIDAKMNTIFAELDKLDGTDSNWTPYQRFLDRYLYKSEKSPNENNIKSDKKKSEAQCSLPLKV
ncbi:3'-5' exoribonuclease YhaM family protein [Desulfovibrio gilichinskyi]|uniref:3'-5' exoribonuclease n=1 Tax=Desulfovibrio gilichinskyi TaxID=1519643 RepID=A0A1X7CD84_9BACT|nr:HD domain-containing protein [Desulfovibrio gilichinskyi]SME94612.1 3'-5' exoribonuclease [Desulfovibrio gilichinskyi]